MAYKITISDGTILEKSIESVTFNANPPSDNFYEMRDFTINSMNIIGKIGAGEKTISLYEWSLLPASNPKCYKEIEVEYTHAGQIVRNVKFSKAFVVDYSESYSKQEGVGHFALFVRQLADIDIDVTSQSSQNAVIDTKSEAIIEKEVVPVVAPIITTKKPERRMSATDIIVKPKEQEYNKIIEGYGARPSDPSDRITEEMVREELATSPIGQQTLDFIDRNNIPVGLTYEPRTDSTMGVCLPDSKAVKIFLNNHYGDLKLVAQTVIHEVTHYMGIQGSKRAEIYCRIRELKHIYNNKIPKGILKQEFETVYTGKSYKKLPLGEISSIQNITKGWR